MSPFGDGRLPRRQQFRGARCEPPVMAQPQQASGPPRLSSRCTRNRERPATPRQKWPAGARCAPSTRLTLIDHGLAFQAPSNRPAQQLPHRQRLPHVRRPTRNENAAAAYNHVPCPSPAAHEAIVVISAATGEPDAPPRADPLTWIFFAEIALDKIRDPDSQRDESGTTTLLL